MHKIADIAKYSLNYTVVQYLVLGIGFVKGIYVAKYLGPELMGSYGLIVLVLEYLRFSNLGTVSAMNLELSVNKGASGKEAYVKKVEDTTFTYMLCIAALCAFAAIVVHRYFGADVAQDVLPYLYAVAFIAIAGQAKIFMIIKARLEERYNLINLIEFVSNVILLAVILFAIKRYMLDAVVGAMVVSSAAIIVLFVVTGSRGLSLRIDGKLVGRLILLGAPLLVYNLFEKVFTTVDRLVILHYLTRTDLGYYTLSTTIMRSTMVILSSFTFLYYPKFLKKFNVKNDTASDRTGLLDTFKRHSRLLESLVVGVGLLGLVLITPFIAIILPQYGESVFLYKMLVLGIIFHYIAYFAGTYLISNKHQYWLIAILACVGVVAAGLNIAAIISGYGLPGIAAATCISMALYSVLKVALVFHKEGWLSLRNLAAVYWKYTLVLTVTIAVIAWYPRFMFIPFAACFVLYGREYLSLLSRFRGLAVFKNRRRTAADTQEA